MARSLTFLHDGASFEAELVKVDRSQLYGSVSVVTEDVDGRRCEMATLANDGKTLIPRGGTALGYVNTEGEWISRDALQPVDPAGAPVVEVASSFDAPVALDDAVGSQALLDHNVRLTYRLAPVDAFPDALAKSFASGAIYRFGFSYRGGVGHDPAFVLSDDDANVWMLVTSANEIEFLSLEQAALCATGLAEDIVDDGEESDDGLDFGML